MADTLIVDTFDSNVAPTAPAQPEPSPEDVAFVQAIIDRVSSGVTADGGFDESKHPRDERGRFGAGNNSAGEQEPAPPGVAWKPVMTRAEADAWAKDSVIRMDVYHGTRSGDAIRQDGFQPGTGGRYGTGVYVTKDLSYAQRMATQPFEGPLPESEVLTARINVKNPAEGDLLYDEVKAQMPKFDKAVIGQQDAWLAGAMQKTAIAQGYDSIHGFYHMGAHEWVVFDPHNVVVVDEPS